MHNIKLLDQYTVFHNLTNSLTRMAIFCTINIITLRVTHKSIYKSLLILSQCTLEVNLMYLKWSALAAKTSTLHYVTLIFVPNDTCNESNVSERRVNRGVQ